MKRNTLISVFILSFWLSFLSGTAPAEDSGNKSRREKAQALVDKGLALNDNSDSEAGFYRRAVRIDPTYAGAHFNLGFLYHSRGELEKAIDYYRQCLRYDPKRHEAHRNLAACLLTVRRDAVLYEVRSHLNMAIELQEDLPPGKQPSLLDKQRAELLDLEKRINRVLNPVVQNKYTLEMITRILSRRVTRGGQGIYEGPRLPMLLFDTGSVFPAEGHVAQLSILATALNGTRLASHAFTIEGHADGRGRAAMNIRLSRLRAKAVRHWLVDFGDIKSGRLNVEAYGEDHPIFPNDSAANYGYNRRIEIVRRYRP